MKRKIILIFLLFSSGCRNNEKVSSFNSVDIDNIPYPLSKEIQGKELLLGSTYYDDESIYIFRQAFNQGTESCIQLKINNDKTIQQEAIYYEYDLIKEFYDNPTRKQVYANRQLNPSVKVIYTKIKQLEIPDITKLPEYSRKRQDEFVQKNKSTPNLMYRYFFYLPKENSFYELRMNYPTNQFDKNEKPVVDWLRKLTKSMSYKEQYYFDLFTTQTKASTVFWEQYGRDNEFYKKIDSVDYAIPSKELDFFMPGSIYEKN